MTLWTTQIATLISEVGFPIAAFWLMYNMATKGISNVKETIEKNTLAINELKIIIKERIK